MQSNWKSGLGSAPMRVKGKCIFSIIVMQKYVKKALEWRRETWQKSICAERPKGVRYLVSALGFFDAVLAGNGSAFLLTFTFNYLKLRFALAFCLHQHCHYTIICISDSMFKK